MAIIGLFSTYSPIDRLILWDFPTQFMVFPSATITWNSSVGYMKKFKSLAILEWIKLWVLPKSINTITFFFLIYPSILRVWGVVIPTKALQDMVGVISSGVSWFFLRAFLVLFLHPLHSLFRIISSHRTYVLYCTCYHNWSIDPLIFFHPFVEVSTL